MRESVTTFLLQWGRLMPGHDQCRGTKRFRVFIGLFSVELLVNNSDSLDHTGELGSQISSQEADSINTFRRRERSGVCQSVSSL